MVMLVSLDQASDYLRRDTTDDDADLTLNIMGASLAVLDYIDPVDFLESSGEVETDSAGNPVNVPPSLAMAVLQIIGVLYTDRNAQAYIEGDDPDRLGKMSLPRIVHWILDAYRAPRLA
jgi:hypothetical protein